MICVYMKIKYLDRFNDSKIEFNNEVKVGLLMCNVLISVNYYVSFFAVTRPS